MKNRLKIGITMGEPCGIGPEVALKALHSIGSHQTSDFIILGDTKILQNDILNLGNGIKLNVLRSLFDNVLPDCINVFNLSEIDPNKRIYGKPSHDTAKAALSYVTHAIDFCKEGLLDGFVTAPLCKKAISEISPGFSGHTEYLAKSTDSLNPVMLMTTPDLKVIPLTTHIPLKVAAASISKEKINRTLLTAHEGLKKFFGIDHPSFALAGLNPHAGEDVFGEEEDKIIAPAISEAREKGINVKGPYPPDSIFLKALKGEFDAVIAMYHDQALIPIKTLYFRKVVNVTLGLPIVRTSPGHGVAFDIAGKGLANHKSMLMALKLATLMASKMKTNNERKSLDDQIRYRRLERDHI